MLAVYLAEVESLLSKPESRKLASLLGPEHRNRFDRLKRPADRRRSLAAELLMRGAVSMHSGTSPELLLVKRNPYGKPFLPNIHLHFNISHSGHWVACAVGDTPLGIDLEEVRSLSRLDEIAAHYFSNQERKMLEACSKNRKRELFFDLWTLKESYLKATGLGLQIPLNSFSIFVGRNGEGLLQVGADSPSWSLRVYRSNCNIRLALCARNRRPPDPCSNCPQGESPQGWVTRFLYASDPSSQLQ